MRKGRNIRRSRRGFSLLEVLLVVVIIGILAAFVVPNLLKTGETAKIDATKAMIDQSGNIALAINLYHTHTGQYPKELKDLYEKPGDTELAERWKGPYINNPNSLKDAWNRDLIYKAPGEHNTDSYDLSSKGPDGEEGGDDDIGNWEKK